MNPILTQLTHFGSRADRKSLLGLKIALTAFAGLAFHPGQATAGTLLFNGADITSGGTATALPANTPAAEVPANLFDNNAATKVLVFNSNTPGTGGDVTTATPVILRYDFAGTDAFTVLSYSVTSANDANTRDPATWLFEGSNDGVTFVPVDSVTGHLFADQPTVGDNSNTSDRFETYFFTVDTPGSYQQYQFRLLETRDPANDRPQIAELQMFTTVVPEPTSLGLLALGSLGLFHRRNRRA